MLSRSTPSSSTSTRILPTAWTASAWNRTSFSCATAHSSRTGRMVPTSLFAMIIEVRIVSLAMASRSL
jgi:hypothetical protein